MLFFSMMFADDWKKIAKYLWLSTVNNDNLTYDNQLNKVYDFTLLHPFFIILRQ